jgi:SAM-dependent methyltransferase
MNPSRLASFLSERARETYPESQAGNLHPQIIARIVPELTKRLPPRARVLDVGCGNGEALRLFFDAGFDTRGTSYNINECDQLILTFPSTHIYFAAQEYLPFPSCDFDLIFARHVLEHSIAPAYVLRCEFHRLLKPDGLLYLEVPSPDTACNHEANKNHYSVLGQRAWSCLIDRAGFDIIEAKRLDIKTMAGPDTYFSFLCQKQ